MASLRLMVTTALLVTVLVGHGSAWVVMHFGTSCPEPEVQQNFDITKYMGRWFEYEKFPNLFEMGSKCVIANYTLLSNSTIKVVNTAIQEYSYGTGVCPWYKSRVAVGSGEVVDAREPAKLGVKFNENAPLGNYWVLETDYVTYSVVYGCSMMMSAMPVYTENAWVLTREKGVAPSNLEEIYQRLTDKGIQPSYFEVADQNGCPDWPAKD